MTHYLHHPCANVVMQNSRNLEIKRFPCYYITTFVLFHLFQIIMNLFLSPNLFSTDGNNKPEWDTRLILTHNNCVRWYQITWHWRQHDYIIFILVIY